MVYWYIGTRSDTNTIGNVRVGAKGVIWRDGVMAGHFEYVVVMIGEDVNGSKMIDGMIHMMSGVNRVCGGVGKDMMFVIARSLQFSTLRLAREVTVVAIKVVFSLYLTSISIMHNRSWLQAQPS